MIRSATRAQAARARAAGLARMRADQAIEAAARALLEAELPEGGPPVARAQLYRAARASGIPRHVLDDVAGRERLRTGRICREISQAIYWQRPRPARERSTPGIVPWHRCGCQRRWRPSAETWAAFLLGGEPALACPSCEQASADRGEGR